MLGLLQGAAAPPTLELAFLGSVLLLPFLVVGHEEIDSVQQLPGLFRELLILSCPLRNLVFELADARQLGHDVVAVALVGANAQILV